jgi:hypothetical protein
MSLARALYLYPGTKYKMEGRVNSIFFIVFTCESVPAYARVPIYHERRKYKLKIGSKACMVYLRYLVLGIIYKYITLISY